MLENGVERPELWGSPQTERRLRLTQMDLDKPVKTKISRASPQDAARRDSRFSRAA